MPKLKTIAEALELVLARSTTLPAETVAVAHAAGRVLASAAKARVDLPPFPSSAMDGFAVRSAETPGTFRLAFRVAAGVPAPAELPPGAAAGIATGAVVPDGADAVVPIEQAVEADGWVEIGSPVAAGSHVRPRGGDVVAGDVAVEGGTRLAASHIGALAAVGIDEVECARRPRVAVLATGSELRPAGADLEPGQIFESNRLMIAAALGPAGADVDVLPFVPDEPGAHRDAVAQGLEADVLVTSGGVSVGPHDLVRRITSEFGVEEIFWGVAVKPGKPLSFGVRGRTLVFGLPGNPVSSLVGTLLFVRPALLALQGASDPRPAFRAGRTAAALRRNGERDQFVRACVRDDDGEPLLEPVSGQESHMIVRAATADALVHIPCGEGEIAPGSVLRYLALE